MVVHCTVYILNITMMINQEKGKEVVKVKVKVVEREVVKVKVAEREVVKVKVVAREVVKVKVKLVEREVVKVKVKLMEREGTYLPFYCEPRCARSHTKLYQYFTQFSF